MNDGVVRLREPKDSDGVLIVKWRNASREYFFNEDPIDLVGHQEYLRHRGGYYFVIERIEGLQPIGTIGLYDINSRHRRAEYGRFLIAPEERRKGYGKRALRLLLQFAFQELGLFKIYGDILAYNTAAIALDLKLGFFREAHLVKHVLRDGRFYDVIRLAILDAGMLQE